MGLRWTVYWGLARVRLGRPPYTTSRPLLYGFARPFTKKLSAKLFESDFRKPARSDAQPGLTGGAGVPTRGGGWSVCWSWVGRWVDGFGAAVAPKGIAFLHSRAPPPSSRLKPGIVFSNESEWCCMGEYRWKCMYVGQDRCEWFETSELCHESDPGC